MAVLMRLLHSELSFCGPRLLFLHLQLNLGDLKAPALNAELQLVAGVMQTVAQATRHSLLYSRPSRSLRSFASELRNYM